MAAPPNWTSIRNAAIFAVAAILYRAVLAGFGEDFATATIGGAVAATWIAVGWLAQRRREAGETTSLRWDIPVALAFFGGSGAGVALVTQAPPSDVTLAGAIAGLGVAAVGVQMVWREASGEDE